MPRLSGWLAAGVLWLVLAPAAPAGAASFARIAGSDSVAVTDGDRFVAYETQAHRFTEVVDTVSGSSRRVRTPACRFLSAVTPSRLVYTGCRSEPDAPRAFSSRTGRRLEDRGFAVAARRMRACAKEFACSVTLREVGTHWLRLQFTRNDVNPTAVTSEFINLDTGAVRPPADSASVVNDTDAPRLYRGLCAPLRRAREPEPNFTGDPRAALPFARPWGLVLDLDRFDVLHCGSAKPSLTVRHHGGVILTRRYVVWQTGGGDAGPAALHAVRLDGGARRSWPVAAYLGPLTAAAFTVTRTQLYLTDFSRFPERVQVLTAGLP